MGRFGKFPGAPRDYLVARYNCMAGIANSIANLDATEMACAHALDMLHFDHRDICCVRHYLVFFMLRLNKDQQAYDLIKWYATKSETYDWDNWNDETYLDITGADVFEDVEWLARTKDLNFLVAVLLIKLRILLDLGTIESLNSCASPTDTSTPLDLPAALRSSILAAHTETLTHTTVLSNIITQTSHLLTLYKQIKRTNKHFFGILLRAAVHIKAYSHMVKAGEAAKGGSVPEAQGVLWKCNDAWIESKGAVEWVRRMGKEVG
ncbi:hypothetical protein HDV00_006729 [Rhizophlyctis rosea]|nr:hypothetical protein HDV00_006729 [Rhizophlyctis rosea]